MPDDIDIANETAEAIRERAMRQRAAVPDAQLTGACLNCGAPLKGRRWCDANCRNDWEAENAN